MVDLEGIDPSLQKGVRALAADMRASGHARHDPVRQIFGMLGDKWTTLILLVLAIGAWRHADLRRALGHLGEDEKISQRMMTLKLRVMEREGLVERTVTDDVPPKVSYSLTPLGGNLGNKVRELIGWVQCHRVAIEAARTVFDLRDGD